MSWILVIHIYAGIWAKTDSVSVTSVSGFASEQACRTAASQLGSLVSETKKDIRTVCVRQQ